MFEINYYFDYTVRLFILPSDSGGYFSDGLSDEAVFMTTAMKSMTSSVKWGEI